MKDLSNYRKSYEKSALTEAAIPANPMDLFERWFHEIESGTPEIEVNAMTVATIGLDGFPKSRVVLLKQFIPEGFVFYTNYESEKGKAIAQNPNVCLSFFWHDFERQVIVKGTTSKVAESVSDAYFASRPVGSQLGALVSAQSSVIPSRDALDQELTALLSQNNNGKIQRPANWGGYLVSPIEMEFWQGRANRLHDRIRFKLTAQQTWVTERLAP